MSVLGDLYAAIPLALTAVAEGWNVYDHEPATPELPGIWPGLHDSIELHYDLGGGMRVEVPITVATGRADERDAQLRMWEALDRGGPLFALERYRVPTMPWKGCAVLRADKPYGLVIGDATAFAVDVACLFLV